MASKVHGTVSPGAFVAVRLIENLNFADRIKGNLSRVWASQDSASGCELEVVKVLQVRQ